MNNENRSPSILALDFDGVICDGLLEYFQTAWRAYCELCAPSDRNPSPELAHSFYRTRPVVETGWEMPLVLIALRQGISEYEILLDWPTIRDRIVRQYHWDAQQVGATVDGLRDEWISRDLDSWLSLHRFYPGIISKLQDVIDSNVQLIIITTKEGRFVRALLQQQAIDISPDQIIGKEYQKPKHQTLREILTQSGENCRIWFVEDRLKTLFSIQQHSDLASIKLYLADWGYNTQADRDTVANYPLIKLLSLVQFHQDWGNWP